MRAWLGLDMQGIALHLHYIYYIIIVDADNANICRIYSVQLSKVLVKHAKMSVQGNYQSAYVITITIG